MSDWVLLRGLTRESRHWGRFPGVLQEHFPKARIHTPDLPGNGLLNGERSPPSIEFMAELCRARLLAEGLVPPCRLLGLSMGGMAALAWAARHPGEVEACVLINSSLAPVNPFYQRLRPGAYLPLAATLLPGLPPRSRESLVIGLTIRLCADRLKLAQDWAGYRRENPVSVGNAVRQLVAAWRFRGAKPVVPCLLLASRRDRLVDSRCSRDLALAWNAAFAEHPDAGHDLPLDDGPWVAARIGQWLAGPG